VNVPLRTVFANPVTYVLLRHLAKLQFWILAMWTYRGPQFTVTCHSAGFKNHVKGYLWSGKVHQTIQAVPHSNKERNSTTVQPQICVQKSLNINTNISVSDKAASPIKEIIKT